MNHPNIGVCMQRAMDLGVPHWGSLISPTAPATPFTNGSSPSYTARPNVTLSMASTPLAEPKGFELTTTTFYECGALSTTWPFEIRNATLAIVFNVTSVTNVNADSVVTLHMASCDGIVSLATTKPGVFVVKGSSAAIHVERWGGSKDNTTKDCVGDSSIAFTSARLEDYCKVDKSLTECKQVLPATGATSSATTTGKQSRLVATAFVVVASLAMALV